MQAIKQIRDYLLSDNNLNTLLGDNIYFVTKPEEKEADDYIVFTYKPLNGGEIKDYQLTFQYIGLDLDKLIQIQERTEFLLDQYRNNSFVGKNNTIYSCSLLNGGGQLYDSTSKKYTIIDYFEFQI